MRLKYSLKQKISRLVAFINQLQLKYDERQFFFFSMHLLKNQNKQVLVHHLPLFLMLANIQFVWLSYVWPTPTFNCNQIIRTFLFHVYKYLSLLELCNSLVSTSHQTAHILCKYYTSFLKVSNEVTHGMHLSK